MAKNDSIAQFINAISKGGGMSMTNGYDVEFELAAPVLAAVRDIGIDPTKREPSQPGYLISLLCDEAQLPNIQSATGQVAGVHMGEAQVSYPHTRMYSDFSLSWMCDANMTPLKFLNTWYNYIFNGEYNQNIKTLAGNRLDSVKTVQENPIERPVRLNFPSEYMATVRVTKTERGANAPNSRSAMSYIIQECYPYAIDAVPLSYGTSQITKVTANFYYRKHTIVYNDISGYKG